MKEKRHPTFLYVIISLASIGLLSWIVKEPGQLIRTLLLAAIMAVVIFFIARAIIRRRAGHHNDEMRKYKQAVKQSQKRYKHYQQNTGRKISQKKLKRRRPTHLTVIKGNKSTKRRNDDRASN